MTYEEFKELKDRVELYDGFNKSRERLIKEKSQIDNGLLEITTAYQHKITFGFIDSEFNNSVVAAISKVYEDKIKKIDMALKAI